MLLKSRLITVLNARGIVNNITNEHKLQAALEQGLGVYVGFDPTAPSLHLGNYLQLVILKRFQAAGVKVVALIGTATGLIGDPSFKKRERPLLEAVVIDQNAALIEKQIVGFLGPNVKVIKNLLFYQNWNMIDFLRTVGKLINVNYLLEKEAISERIKTGLSFTEFSYPLLQGYDFLHLFETEAIGIQCGGSDQWGNITTGIEIIRKKHGNVNVCGMTLNLLVDKNQQKFGKSEKGALFLDPQLTSPYLIYQELLNQDDVLTQRLLLALTFLPLAEITQLQQQHERAKSQKMLQKKLAATVIIDLFGSDILAEIIALNQLLFTSKIMQFNHGQLALLRKYLPIHEVDKTWDFARVLCASCLTDSLSAARRLISQKAVIVNEQLVLDAQQLVENFLTVDSSYLVIKKAKKYFAIVKVR